MHEVGHKKAIFQTGNWFEKEAKNSKLTQPPKKLANSSLFFCLKLSHKRALSNGVEGFPVRKPLKKAKKNPTHITKAILGSGFFTNLILYKGDICG